MARPLIGVTKPSQGDNAAFAAMCLAVRLAGGAPVRLSASSPGDGLRIDGLLLGGGTDIHPKRFHTPPKPGYDYDVAREHMELAWLERADRLQLPVLGICRGAQFMNVAAGGALHMDLTEEFQPARYPQTWWKQLYFRKRILITRGSRLHRITGQERLCVNSIHKQAVGKVGEGLMVSAREENGVAQAIERSGERFWLGVQFHPEFLQHRKPFRSIFAAFIQAAAGR
ncbi:gamma-glutamyl-gamma-aminobutyrate hydrolase family protein [Caulobacter sp. S45]|uniref:gamma-glutamyl-gamma-aminobutyrate hydrolase family protein n=1 Tax=Caulobacter sp. S45 TaxID=1641861 RepID=UPI00131D1162|nr:gamma-glutamyl-gamma-aminobutyrate hydrolase family protein [Caulobacter sp. S45]